MKTTKTWQGHEGPVLDSVKGFDVIECGPCGFRHIVPVPDDEDIAGYYKEQFYAGEKEDYCERHQSEIQWWNQVYEERYLIFEKHLSQNQRRILDIGSGPGFFLKFGKERNWKTKGIEPSVQAAAFARNMGLEIDNEVFDETSAKKLGKFDVIHMNGVMEHLPNPKNFLNICNHILNPGGLLFTCVANEYSPFQEILVEHLGYRPWWLVPPEHINYFDMHSIEKLVASSGFEVLQTTTTFPMELFLLMGDNYVGDESVGKECHRRRKNLEFALKRSGNVELKRKIYKGLSALGIGREIELTARKPLSKTRRS
jgi:SAM-dependent methyltransferase